jgi:hypothetical protein
MDQQRYYAKGEITVKKYIFIMSICLLPACGGGGGSDDANESPAGIWEGTGVTSDNEEGEIVGLVASNGKAFFLTDLPALVFGDVTVSGSNFRLNGTAYEDDFDPDAITMSGTVSSGTSINANYSTSDESGTISLSMADSSIGVYDRSSNLQKLEGIWNDEDTDSEGTWVFTIQSSGSFSAIRVTDNCTMNGDFATIDSTKNEYSVTVTTSSCDEFNGNYSGLAFTSDANTFTDNVVSLAIANSQYAGIFEATKQ